MTFIALEGVDGAGKTSLATAVIEELHDRFPDDEVHYMHASQLKRDALDEYALSMENYRPGTGEHWVIDRWHWGELIYGPLYRDKSALSEAAYRWTELFLAARGGTVWHVTAALDTIKNRLSDRGEDYLQSHHVEHVWSSFSAIAEKSLTTGGTAVTDVHGVHVLAKQVVDQAVFTEDQAKISFRSEYIGRSLPTVLLVGDKQGDDDPGVTKAPFMPRGRSCGTFLFDALPELWWHQLGFVNANETDLPVLIESLVDPVVIALGKNASKTLEVYGIEHGAVPHPSYVRRFNVMDKEAYGALIRQVSTSGEKRFNG